MEKDERAIAIERAEIERLAKDRDDEKAILERNVYSRLREILGGQTATTGPRGVKAGTPIDAELLDKTPRRLWWDLGVDDAERMAESQALKRQLEDGYKLSRSGSRTRSRSCSGATSSRPACSRWSRCSSR